MAAVAHHLALASTVASHSGCTLSKSDVLCRIVTGEDVKSRQR